MRVFLDSNVLIAALATRGICADLLRLVLCEHQLVASTAVLKALRTILITRLGLRPALADQVIPFFRERAELSVAQPATVGPSAELPYHQILGAALAGEADVLVTSDRALLAQDEQASVHITDPRGFWELLTSPR